VDRLDDNTLNEIARLIVGDDGPLYRQGWELPGLFRRATWNDVPDFDGSSRREWALIQLIGRRGRPEEIEKVILRLADAREYLGEPGGQEKAILALNAFLIHEGYKVQRPGGRPKIVECDPVDGGPTDAAPVQLQTTLHDLVRDSQLARILQSRLDEAQTCRSNGAYTACIILLGSLLEGVLIVTGQQRLTAAEARRIPRETLENLIDFAHGREWIQSDARNFSQELRRYRNLVHPWAEVRAGHPPDRDTVDMCWPVIIAALNDLAATGSFVPAAPSDAPAPHRPGAPP
jgi:hypothetical protein